MQLVYIFLLLIKWEEYIVRKVNSFYEFISCIYEELPTANKCLFLKELFHVINPFKYISVIY